MKIRSNIDLSGLKKLPDDVDAALLEAAERIVLADSQRRVPYEEGKLAGSARVRRAGKGRVSVGYYWPGAVAAHERLDVRPGRGRERKYLETALNSTRLDVLRHLADAARKTTG